MQEDYETFKEHMEEKADRQDAISSALEGAQTRLEDAEANIVALTEELEHSAQETRVSYLKAHVLACFTSVLVKESAIGALGMYIDEVGAVERVEATHKVKSRHHRQQHQQYTHTCTVDETTQQRLPSTQSTPGTARNRETQIYRKVCALYI